MAENQNQADKSSAQSSLRVAVTGHRALPTGSVTWLPPLIDNALAGIADGQPATLLCGMAAGADLLVAQRAKDMGPSWQVKAVLPYQAPLFRARLGDGLGAEAAEDARRRFDAMMAQCDDQITLAQAGAETEIPPLYAALGAYLVAHSDHILVLWNGDKTRKTGGTYDVLCMARTAGLKATIIHLGERRIAWPD